MKRKILSILLLIVASFMLVIEVKAFTAKAPTSIPNDGSEVYATIDESFDFSKIKFATADGGVTNGKSSISKIRLAESYTVNSENLGQSSLSNNWFSAYCLDPNSKYPDSSLSFALSQTANSSEDLFNTALVVALQNSAKSNSKLYNLLTTLKGYFFSEAEVEVPAEYMDGTNIKYDDIVHELSTNRNSSIPIRLKKLTYAKTSPVSVKELTGSEINTALELTGDAYEYTLTNELVMYNKYTTMAVNTASSEYKAAFWIIEHSYPTLSLDRMYEDIGINKDTLNQEIVTLEGITNNSADELNEIVENYVYSTIQYAIWKSTGSKVDGVTLGNSLEGSAELNKLYQYYISERDYSSYFSTNFGSSLSIVKPSTKSEIYEETKTNIKYGPYSVKSNMISSGTINLTTNATSGVKLLNESGSEISSVKEGEKFYVLVEKNSKASTILIKAQANNGYTFSPSTNRGRIYYAFDPLTQNVATAGIIKQTTGDTTFSILTNPTTGIVNVGLLFVVTLALFSVGYLFIVRTNKPVEL